MAGAAAAGASARCAGLCPTTRVRGIVTWSAVTSGARAGAGCSSRSSRTCPGDRRFCLSAFMIDAFAGRSRAGDARRPRAWRSCAGRSPRPARLAEVLGRAGGGPDFSSSDAEVRSPRCGAPSHWNRRHDQVHRVGRGCFRQRPGRDDDRALQDRVRRVRLPVPRRPAGRTRAWRRSPPRRCAGTTTSGWCTGSGCGPRPRSMPPGGPRRNGEPG